ncbi:CAMK family protein kinase [Trichomonas vaginalis G3]|uniref:CAMK family protein kinase n=1 Tax=Trichomonas vaginalis (strain ATCC PRA-98 / G3) TaxID=412133 RepID=A2FHU2_TRIV3|nr:protein serine/threonine kinase protein [Trichomonas vaginalis G3]EAX95515.1 CAMK family protein kinase [Trichomonas vaginalis G3]KAI5495006.1 protein serine/threonine kinase protein [Trichomonas vaginalis G3]|eukprot:XP_001308445.1 CAMK family protein kinase [Trichomonas vaginalis G3]
MTNIPSTIGDFEIREEISKSLFSTVHIGIHSQSGNRVAIKVLNKTKFQSPDDITRIQRELHLHMKLLHPLISQMFGYYEDDSNYYLIIEYSENGTLLQHINKNGPIIEQLARRYFIQLLIAVEYLHNVKKIAHRDIKLENILFDSFYNIRLTDFGISKDFENQPEFHTICGSPSYLAPEIIQGHPYSTKSDIWSLGVVLYAMVNGKLPFDASNQKELFHKILKENVTFNANVSPQLKDLLTKMLNKNQNARISLEQIKEHQWFSITDYNIVKDFLECLESESIDQIVRNQLENISIDTKGLLVKLHNENSDSATIAYKLLSRTLENKDMRAIFRSKIQKRQRSSAEYDSPISLPKKLCAANKPKSQVFDKKIDLLALVEKLPPNVQF